MKSQRSLLKFPDLDKNLLQEPAPHSMKKFKLQDFVYATPFTDHKLF